MAPRTLFIVILVSSSLFIDSAEADWKFWKSKKKEEPTTTTTSTTAAPVSLQASGAPQTPGSGATVKAIASAADPGLVVGVGTTGTTIKSNARPERPNPGTEVGQDVSNSRPSRPGGNPNAYRDWAMDLTGAGEPSRPGSKVLGPAGTPQGQPAPGTRPGSASNPASGQVRPASAGFGSSSGSPGATGAAIQPGSAAAGATGPGQRPSGSVSGSGSVNSASGQGQRPPAAISGPASSMPNSGSGQKAPGAGQRPPASVSGPGLSTPGSGPGQVHPGSSSGSAGSGQKPAGTGQSWADVAAGGSRPGSPTPAPRPAQSQPHPQPARPSPGATIAAGAGVAAVGAVAISGTSGKVYSSNPTYSKGNGVTDEDLEKLTEALFIKDNNNAWRHITLNLQKKTTSSSPVDEAPQPLLTVNSAALQIPTIVEVLKLHDNYQLDTRTNEYISPAQREEESRLVDTFLSTNVMSAAMRFLADKNIVRKDYYVYKDTLRRLWFNLYSRGDGKIGSAGFEHVFLTELKLGTEVSGLHNWIYFNAEELKRRVDYLGYIKKLDLGDKAAILKLHAKFNGIDKPVTTMFIGTSPELEMALYTVCFYTRPDQTCPVSLGGTKFNIITHKFKYRGHDLIGSAYPDI